MLWDMSQGCTACDRSSNGVFSAERCCSFNEDDGFDKENMQECIDGAHVKQENEECDLSLYENSSPLSATCDGSPSHCLHQLKRRRPLQDLDSNSRDSGYGANYHSDSNRFFSPKKSFNSHGSADDDFFDICGLEDDDENARLPGDFNKLLSGSLLATCDVKKCAENFVRPILKHSVSLIDGTPNSTKARSCLFKRDDEIKCFKRPEPPTETQSPTTTKRSKVYENETTFKPRTLVRSISLPANEDSIKSALQRSSDEPDLIGDFSKQFSLPLITGKHADLKSITPTTLVLLVKGHFQQCVSNYKIIDCRYPYEYNGGHIQGALNLYTKEQIMDELLEVKLKDGDAREQADNKRDILIFHCEFSSERGPNLSRFLRQLDRKHNKNAYPFLHYPEVYLLDGGYKDFYKQFAELCIPEAYLPMLHPNYEHDLKHFRTKSKTFNVDTRSKNNLRSLFKRL